MSGCIYPPEVADALVRTIHPFYLQSMFTLDWLEVHANMIELGKHALLEPPDLRENSIGDTLVGLDKLGALVHEVFCASIWKHCVLQYLKFNAPLQDESSIASEVFWHEYAAIILLESALKYEKAPLSLCETSLDLVDYCVQALKSTFVLVRAQYQSKFKVKYFVAHQFVPPDFRGFNLTECERQKRDCIWKIGLRCLSILKHLTRSRDLLPPNFVHHIFEVHDVPWILCDAVTYCPWYKFTNQIFETFEGDSWTELSTNDIYHTSVYEIDTWKLIRELVLDEKLMCNYNLTFERQKRLAKATTLLSTSILEMAPELWDLKHYLGNINTISVYLCSITQDREFSGLEEFPLLRDDIINKANVIGGYAHIASQQENFFLCKTKDEILTLASSLEERPKPEVVSDNAINVTTEKCQVKNKVPHCSGKNYNSVEDLTLRPKPRADYLTSWYCDNCGQKATQMCAICCLAYYCSHHCQKEQWPFHKVSCKN